MPPGVHVPRLHPLTIHALRQDAVLVPVLPTGNGGSVSGHVFRKWRGTKRSTAEQQVSAVRRGHLGTSGAVSDCPDWGGVPSSGWRAGTQGNVLQCTGQCP